MGKTKHKGKNKTKLIIYSYSAKSFHCKSHPIELLLFNDVACWALVRFPLPGLMQLLSHALKVFLHFICLGKSFSLISNLQIICNTYTSNNGGHYILNLHHMMQASCNIPTH